MAHELAHQYWGHVAQMSSYEDQWLSESTAEYYGAVAVGHFLGNHKLRAAQQTWKSQLPLIGEAPSIYLANRLTGEKAGRERYGLLYARGPLMLQELRDELGDQAFFTVFKSLLTNFRFKPVDTGTFLELVEFVTKKDYGPWFEKRLFGLE
jgi:aminopeptidase N